MVVEQIADQEVGVDGDTVILNLARYFSDLDSASLAYVATSSDPDVATVTVMGDTATITSVGDTEGTTTITVSATDNDGSSVMMEFTVTIRTEITRSRWRDWRLAAILAARDAQTRARRTIRAVGESANPVDRKIADRQAGFRFADVNQNGLVAL